MGKRLVLVFVLAAGPLFAASFYDFRFHCRARVHCERGPVIALIVRGPLWRLTERERGLLNTVEREMRAVENSPIPRSH